MEKSYFNLDLNKFEFLNYNLFLKYIFNKKIYQIKNIHKYYEICFI